MGDSRKIIFFVATFVILLSIGMVGFSDKAFADKKGKENTTPIINLGYLQLAAHDLFDMNRTSGNDNENGKLDLSTVLFNPQSGKCDFEKSLNQEEECSLYDEQTIAQGGEKRSVENIMISTASAEVGEKYLQFAKILGEEKGYKKVLGFYHNKLKQSYEESFHLKFPKPQEGEVTNMHNLALRTGHDFLPAEIIFDGQITSIFAIPPLEEKLSKEEQKQPSSPVDGKFDEEFLGIDFCPAPGFCINVNLLNADQSFGEQFGLGEHTFDSFMMELEDGKYDESDQVSMLLEEAFARGLNFN